MKRVLTFGVFDGLHEGHRNLFDQCAGFGDHLLVVVARDSAVLSLKGKRAKYTEDLRLAGVLQEKRVAEALLGDEWPAADPYGLLSSLDFEVLALGYDQKPTDEDAKSELGSRGKHDVTIVRLRPFRPDTYKSSLLL